MKFNIPIEVKVTVGTPGTQATDSSQMTDGSETSLTEIQIPVEVDVTPKLIGVGASEGQPPQIEHTSSGYDPNFLRVAIDTPSLPPTLLPDAFTLNGSHLIPYTHFSVCQSMSRRLPRFVAWNIDGGQIKKISRDGIRFKLDTRVPKEFQAGNELYKHNDYDRGHVARRADVVWGEINEAKKANVESFFFTNITPQHKKFNQSSLAGLWGELENAIFEDIEIEDLRVSVMAGPVFKEDDPTYRGVKIPREFWKLLAFHDASIDQFRVAAYILSQSDQVFTETLDLEPFKLHQVSINSLSDQTGLNFGSLTSLDSLQEITESISRDHRREIGGRSQLLAWDETQVLKASRVEPETTTTTRRTRQVFDHDSFLSSEFSWRTAFSLALSAQLSYETPDSIIHTAKHGWGFDSVQVIDVADSQCFIADSPNAVVVAFRGTENVADWMTNLSVFKTERSYGGVHSGFANAFDLVKPLIRAHLANSLSNGQKLWLTGHSLGGAMATIAAAELVDEFPISGIYTIGQPRVGDHALQRFIASRYRERFHRIVNDDDMVTRVPPGYQHVGDLYHLGPHGGLLNETPAATESLDDLSDSDFAGLKVEFQAIQTASATMSNEIERTMEAPSSAMQEMLDGQAIANATTEGLFPSLSDHRTDRYIAKIRRLARQESRRSRNAFESIGGASPLADDPEMLHFSKVESILEVSSQLESMNVATDSVRKSVSANRSEQGSPVLLRLSNENWTPPAGIKIQTRMGSFATARCTDPQIELLRNDPVVMSVEASRDAGMPEVANSVPFTRASEVQRPPLNENGSDAIVGVIDTGIDILHDCFRGPDGTSRILGIWNQRSVPHGGFDSPNETFPNVFTQDYGVFYGKNDIDRLIQAAASNEPIPPALRDPHRHGTHVSSIAAGAPAGGFAGGVAPEAKLLVVIPNMETNPGDPPSLGYSNSHVDALDFLLRAARAPQIGQGLPLAINVSLGMNAGAHDGLSTLEAAFDSATNNGRDRGIVIVKSAGNEGNSAGHAELQAFQGLQEILWDSKPVPRRRDYIEVWYNTQHEFEFQLEAPNGQKSQIASSANTRVMEDLGGNFCTLVLTEFHPDCGDHRLQVTIVPNTNQIQSGRWKLLVNGLTVRGGDQRVHAWVERDRARAVEFQTGDPNAMTISIPGTAEHVITVSACGSQLPLQLTSSSSRGLTRDLRPKPDLCAPGTQIVAAASNGSQQATIPMTGTSMAAPHVAGAIALAMSLRRKQGKQQLNTNQIRKLMQKHAMGVNGTHNPGFGFGALNAEEFVNAAVSLP